MNNREPLEAAMVGTATFLSKTVMIALKIISLMLIASAGFVVGIILGAMRRH